MLQRRSTNEFLELRTRACFDDGPLTATRPKITDGLVECGAFLHEGVRQTQAQFRIPDWDQVYLERPVYRSI